MASAELSTAPSANMADNNTSNLFDTPKAPQSAPDSTRRHSLPTSFLPPSFSSNRITGTGITTESGEAVRGEHILDEAAIAHRLSALRQLNGGRTRGHRYAKSTGARSSTFNQPVIVRTYSGAARPRSQQRDPLSVRKENVMTKSKSKGSAKLPPIEAFTFKGIMDEIKHNVSEDLERIAEICARSKYSLSNQYEVHMPPHGRGEAILHTTVSGHGPPVMLQGPTLQAIESDDDHPRPLARMPRGGRRTRSAAQGTLETIMSSSRSSDEDQSKKKPAAELAEEVRERVNRRRTASAQEGSSDSKAPSRPVHARSKSISFATTLLENTAAVKHGPSGQPTTSLTSEPARPQTSAGLYVETATDATGPRGSIDRSNRYSRSGSESMSGRNVPGVLPTIVENLNTWFPWKSKTQAEQSNAEGSLKSLLQCADVDKRR